MLLGLTDLVLRRPWTVIVVMLLSFAGFGYGMRFMTTDTDVTRDLPQRIPAKALYDRIDKLFPSKEMVIIGVEAPELFSVASITTLDSLTRRIEALDEVQSVMSPTNARIISAVDGGMQVREAADPLPTTPEQAAAFKDKLYAQPLYVGALVTADATSAALMVFIKAGVREANVAEKIIGLAADPAVVQGLTLHVTGRPAATYWSKILMGRDMGMLSSAALGIVILLLLVAFRSVRGVLLPVGVVVSSVVWVLGLMGYAGIPITHSTEVMPILLVAIGVADGIHILKGYYARARGGGDARGVVRETMADLNRPVVLTSITTMAGFLALGTSGVESITYLGVLTSFGVLAALAFSLTFIPAVLSLLRLPGARSEQGSGHFLLLERAAQGYANFLVRRRGAVGLAVLVVIALAVVGSTQVPVEMSNLDNYRPDHPFRLATEAVNRHFKSTTNLLVIVEGNQPDAIKDPEILGKMDALETWLKSQPHVGAVQSMVGPLKQMHRVMHGDTADQYRLPGVTETEKGTEIVDENGVEVERAVTFEVPGRELVAQYLALYEMSGKPGDFANAVTYDYATARMTVFLDSDRASVITEMHDKVSGFIDANFGGVTAELTGMAELMRAVNNMVVTGQAWSIASSLVLVLVLTGFMFRSATVGLFCTLPLFFSLFLNFGFMGLTGIPLNIMTMATSSIAVGVGIDYAIHFVHRYQHDRRTGLDFGEAVVATMRSSGVAILVNAVTVALGFMALFFSEFGGVADMGLLISLTMVTSAFAALTILPVLFVLLRPKAFAVDATSAEVTTP
ncbi:MAG: MMPL family transporter [Pseudomonadota bacterium]